MRALLYLAFVLSGAAGLIYEVTWSRYLALFVGHSAYAQVLVIATFLGGMALGALAVGQRSRRLERPLLWYAGVEAALAGLGLAYDPFFRWMTGTAYSLLFPALDASGAVTALSWALGVLSVLPASILLGTTFPLLSAGVLRAFPRGAGRTLGSLYFANSLGGAMGVLVGGFILVAAFGLPGTLTAAALLNAVAGLAAYGAARGHSAPVLSGEELERVLTEPERGVPPDELRTGTGAPPPPRGTDDLWGLLLGVSFLTAVASFVYEIGWIRMLSLVMGSATHSFEIMLSAFILGLALGALEIRRRADREPRPLRLLGYIQWGMGLAALATLPIYAASFDWMAELLGALDTTSEGYGLFNLSRYGLAAMVMMPSTFLAGMTLPLITTILLRAGRGERSIGWVYGTNTLGSIVGVVLAGLLLLPWLGLKGMLVAGALLDMGVGVVLLHRSREPGEARFRRIPGLAAAGALVVAAAMLLVLRWDRAVLTSGVYRYGRVSTEATRPVLYYQDGRTATVGAYLTPGDSAYVLSTNGKPDASLTQRWIRAARQPLLPRPVFRQDETTQLFLALLGLAHHPEARNVAVVGQGSGITGHYLLGSPRVERLVTVELEPAMVEGSRVFYPANRRVFDDPRSRLAYADAKSFFARRGEEWDLIVSEPSNPWVSGTASLFTVEFYRQIRRHLEEDGVLVQWIHLYEMEDRLLGSVLAAFHRVFSDYRAFRTSAGDLVLVGGNEPNLPPPDWDVFDFPDIRRDLQHIPPFRPKHLRPLWVFDRTALAPLLDRWGPVNSDYFPVLDLGAERARYLESFAEGVDGLSGQGFPVPAALSGWRMPFEPYEHAPLPGLFPMWSWARGSWLREVVAGRRDPEPPPLPPFRGALHQHWRLVAGMESGDPPVDWTAWIQDVIPVEAALHGGTAGSADSAFYRRLFDHLERWDAPPEARDAVAFLHGLAAWDFSEAADAAGALLDAAEAGRTWLPPSLFLDGAVVACLKAGRLERARRALGLLAPRTGRAPDDFRLRLLEAHLIEAEGRDPGSP